MLALEAGGVQPDSHPFVSCQIFGTSFWSRGLVLKKESVLISFITLQSWILLSNHHVSVKVFLHFNSVIGAWSSYLYRSLGEPSYFDRLTHFSGGKGLLFLGSNKGYITTGCVSYSFFATDKPVFLFVFHLLRKKDAF